MSIIARLDEQAFDPPAELAELTGAAVGDGSVVSFVGIARFETGSGEPVEQLVLEHHPRLTPQSLRRIASEAADRFPVSHIRVVHRCGAIRPGEPIVFAAAASRHRRAAFEAADYLMDRLKTEAIFWKREDHASGSTWIEPTRADHAARGRWE